MHFGIHGIRCGVAIACLLVMTACRSSGGDGPDGPLPSGGGTIPTALEAVQSWAYQIQGLDSNGAIDALVQSGYDLLVIEPTRTDVSSSGFDTKGMVARLKASTGHDGASRKLVLAYIDIGEAENWRWYWTWSAAWPAGRPRPPDWPSWILEPDPDGWSGDFPVAFWDLAWKDIVIYGTQHPVDSVRNYTSVMDEVVQDGFDGVYLDWVEIYEDPAAIRAAAAAGVDPNVEIVRFISEIRDYGRRTNPDFIVIQQNAADLIEDNPDVLNVVDGLGQEDTWYGGASNCAWPDPHGYGLRQDPATTRDMIRLADLYLASGRKVFTIDYTVGNAPDVYTQAAAKGYVAYCSRTSLCRLTTTPPPGY